MPCRRPGLMVVCVFNPTAMRPEFFILPSFAFGYYSAVLGWNRVTASPPSILTAYGVSSLYPPPGITTIFKSAAPFTTNRQPRTPLASSSICSGPDLTTLNTSPMISPPSTSAYCPISRRFPRAQSSR